MCRGQKNVDSRIHRMCMLAMTDEEHMAELGETLLELFHDVCRYNTIRANDMVSDLCYFDEYPGQGDDTREMEEALVRLEYFTSESRRDRYENEIQGILRTGQLIRIMDALKCTIYSFGKQGPEFVSILSTCYMNAFDYSYEEASEVLNMGVSTLYKKKRRAVILFGLAFLDYKASLQGKNHMNGFGSEGSQVCMGI